jgi:hypothetical protein
VIEPLTACCAMALEPVMAIVAVAKTIFAISMGTSGVE